jgi:methylamine dehydrogenase heavy chain
MSHTRWICLAILALLAAPVRGEVPIDRPGVVEVLPSGDRSHWAWVGDPLLERMALVDLDRDQLLGVVDGGWGIPLLVVSPDGSELYVPETHYSRGSRGTRTDVVTFYDATTLEPTGEVVIPDKRAINVLPSGNAALSDDGRFLAVFNMNPATSVTIVDTKARRLVGEIATPGCSLVYAGGSDRFLMLCSDGSLQILRLAEDGTLAERSRSKRFFDPQRDPVTEKAVRVGDRWIFVSFEGMAHEVALAADGVEIRDPWPLLGDRDSGWRVGGVQHLAAHAPTQRLYSLVHQGGIDTHKDPGFEVWIYDLAKRERVDRFELANPGLTYLGVSMEFGREWIWPFNRLYDAVLAASNLGIDAISVTGDESPLLVTTSMFSGSLAVYDALSGELVGRVTTGNATNSSLYTPTTSTSGAGRR